MPLECEVTSEADVPQTLESLQMGFVPVPSQEVKVTTRHEEVTRSWTVKPEK